MEYVQAHKQEPTEENYTDLCVDVVKSGIREEGLSYLDTDGGQYWCDLAGISPESLRAKYETFIRDGYAPIEKQPERIREKASSEDHVYKTLEELTHAWCNVELDKPE